DGSAQYFCGMKCEKNLLKLKRNPSRFKWTLKSAKEKSEAAKAKPAAREAKKE
ncbi:hypothetical protein HZB89_02220, partial [archaeon]|nr:hypothetical protein [archaeon]